MSQDQLDEWLLYLRRSNGRKAVPRQRAITTAYIARQGGTVLDEFPDADRTAFRKVGGAQPKRDEFERMLTVLRSRRGLRIGAWHADRLSRNDADTTRLIEVCAENGHLIETPTGGTYDLSTTNGRRRFREDASAAIYEVDHGRERTLAGRDDVAAGGRWLGGKRPFGWRLDEHPRGEDGAPLLDEDGDPMNGVLALDEAEAAAIREGSAAVLTGTAPAAIARKWNTAGLTGTLGAKWTGNEVRRVLTRPRNAGFMEHRGQVIGKASWPAIVDEPTWRRVCTVLGDPARKTTPGPERRHLLSGLAVCGVCGAGLICSPTGGGSRPKRIVYRCRASVAGDEGTGAPRTAHVGRDEATLDAFIAALVIDQFRRPGAERMLLRQATSELPALYKQKAALADAMKASNDLRRAGLLTAAEFASERTEHQQQGADLEKRIAAAEVADVLSPMVRDPAATWEAADLGQRRAIIGAMMTITVHPQGKGRPRGWKPGEPYFDPATIEIGWKRG